MENFPLIEHLKGWISWKDKGIGTTQWSKAYREIQIPYLIKFIKVLPEVSARNLEVYLSNIPVTSNSKRKHIHSAVSSFANFLLHKGLLSTEEREKIRKLYPRRSRYHPPNKKIITKTDLSRILEVAKLHHCRYQRTINTTLIRILSLTGLRVSELCNLDVADFVDFPQTRAHLRVVKGKGGKDRIVPLMKEAVSILQDYLKVRPKVSLKQLFIGFNPQYGYTALNRHCVARRLKRISNATGIAFTAHSLRHFCITNWSKEARFSLPIIQKLAGHSSITVTEGYFNLVDDDLFEAFTRT